MNFFSRVAGWPARVPYIAQLEAVECGAACLAMVLAYHAHHAPLPEVREACAVSRDGVNALAILRAAESFGLQSSAYRAELEALADLPLPAILHWEFSHFVVLERLERDGGARLVDPAHGRLRVSRDTLAKSFTGAVLVFTPGPGLRPRMPRAPKLDRYRELVHEHSATIGQLVAFSLVLQLAGLAFPVGQQVLIDDVVTRQQDSWLWVLALALGLAVLIQGLVQFTRGWVLGTLQTALDLRLLSGFMRHLVRLPIGFFLQRNPGDLLQRLESNTYLRNVLSAQIAAAVLDSLLILSYGALMLVYHWPLGLLVIGIGAARALLQLALRGLNRQAVAAELAALSGVGSTLVESLTGLETIRAVSAESVTIRRWSERVVQRANASLPRLQLDNTAVALTALLSAVSSAAVNGMAAYEVIDGRMSLGVFSAFLTLQGLYLTPFNSLIESWANWQYLGSYLARLGDVTDAAAEPSGDLDAASLRGEIRLDSVGFRYAPGGRWVLRGIHLDIRPGEKIAIVGPSGAGKTTLARILLGMLAPSEGTLSFDGIDMRRYDLVKLRARMGAVLQETSLLRDTVYNNIGFADPDLLPEQVRSAARLACVHDVIIALPRGYRTLLGEDGMQLSGGERQRLCLARALVRTPAVLVLDEATSALDAATERRVHANLGALDCTRIVIAHRFATVRDADRIIVVDGGRIVQQGTFAELSDRQGLFRSLLDSLDRAGD